MPTPSGAKQRYLDGLAKEVELRRGIQRQKQEELALARLEDAAETDLTAQERTTLVEAGVLNQGDASEIQAELDRVMVELGAIQALALAVRRADR
jgi:hypothetical protein